MTYFDSVIIFVLKCFNLNCSYEELLLGSEVDNFSKF